MSVPTADGDGFESPEQGAMDSWSDSPGSRVRITSTETIGDRAEVVLAVGNQPEYLEYTYFIRRDGRWHETVSGSGPTERWWDGSFLDW